MECDDAPLLSSQLLRDLFDNGSVWQRVVEVPIVAPVVRHHYRHSTTITRTTTARPGVVAAASVYDELKRGPRLYDVATPAAVAPAVQPAVPAAPVLGATAVGGPVAMPTYRYVYQPDRILVIDPYTNIAVQAIPR